VTDKPIKVLMIEDNLPDVLLVREMLKEVRVPRFDLCVADQLASGIERLRQDHHDIVILDLGLPDSQGLDTLRELSRQFPNVPILVMTGLADEDAAIKAVQEGAQDYVLKGTTDGKLFARSLRYAIERKLILDERDMLIGQLQEAIDSIKVLKQMVPICSYCKKIRNDEGFWEQLEAYVTEHTGSVFSHGICVECEKKVREETEEELRKGERESGRAGERESGRAGERESGRAGER
jgi:DNA-binding NarL/FixJ family response regulator